MKAVSLSFYFYKCTESVLLISVVMMYILTKFLRSLLHPHPLCRQCDHHLDLARDDNDDDHNICRFWRLKERRRMEKNWLIISHFGSFWTLGGFWPRFGPSLKPHFGSVASVLNLLFRDKEVLAAERAVEKQKMEENLVENKMNVILDSGLFSKVLTMMKC